MIYWFLELATERKVVPFTQWVEGRWGKWDEAEFSSGHVKGQVPTGHPRRDAQWAFGQMVPHAVHRDLG